MGTGADELGAAAGSRADRPPAGPPAPPPIGPLAPPRAGPPAPPPHHSPAAYSEATPVAVGTSVWALLFVIGLFIRDDLADSGRGWWVWSAGAGVVLGFVGYLYLRRRHARIVRLDRVDRVDQGAEG